MGGFFGIVSKQDCMVDVFFGIDYHSHLGARRGGMAAYDPQIGLQRTIHNIENSPFRTKFEKIFDNKPAQAEASPKKRRNNKQDEDRKLRPAELKKDKDYEFKPIYSEEELEEIKRNEEVDEYEFYDDIDYDEFDEFYDED